MLTVWNNTVYNLVNFIFFYWYLHGEICSVVDMQHCCRHTSCSACLVTFLETFFSMIWWNVQIKTFTGHSTNSSVITIAHKYIFQTWILHRLKGWWEKTHLMRLTLLERHLLVQHHQHFCRMLLLWVKSCWPASLTFLPLKVLSLTKLLPCHSDMCLCAGNTFWQLLISENATEGSLSSVDPTVHAIEAVQDSDMSNQSKESIVDGLKDACDANKDMKSSSVTVG